VIGTRYRGAFPPNDTTIQQHYKPNRLAKNETLSFGRTLQHNIYASLAA